MTLQIAPRALAWTLAMLGALTLNACVESDNNFDHEAESFYYGCNLTEDCIDPRGESVSYVCCYDKLEPDAMVCEGRCLRLDQCPEEALLNADPSPCAGLQ